MGAESEDASWPEKRRKYANSFIGMLGLVVLSDSYTQNKSARACVCVCVCARARSYVRVLVRARARVCVWVCGWMGGSVWMDHWQSISFLLNCQDRCIWRFRLPALCYFCSLERQQKKKKQDVDN